VVGRDSRGDNEVGEHIGVHGGAYLVQLEDGLVHEEHEAGDVDEHAAATATHLLLVAVGAEHGERQRRRLLVNRGAREGGRRVCVH
jgi:hypothetical protein